MEDIEVIRRVKSGDTEAFSILVEKYHRHLLNFIFRLIADEGIVEDIGQEVFLSIYKSLKDFDEDRGAPFSAWLFVIARNRCIAELRKKNSNKHMSVEETYALWAESGAPEDMLMKKEQWEAIKTSSNQLSDPFRNTILSSLHGNTVKEIAKNDGISSGTVKSRLFRAKQKIKVLVREYFGDKEHEKI